ncbi:MAG: HEPN domain-containing protein [Candidatus Korarchaeota archaeon]|nr:HEPN domain-containing protein [Candidatus Korarchaeota archaeon]
MKLEEAREILEEAKKLHSEDKCASSIRKSQESVKVALRGFLKSLGIEPTGALSDHLSRIPADYKESLQRILKEACGESVWITMACDARLEKPIAGPEEGSCTRLDSEAAIRSAEKIISLLEEMLGS